MAKETSVLKSFNFEQRTTALYVKLKRQAYLALLLRVNLKYFFQLNHIVSLIYSM